MKPKRTMKSHKKRVSITMKRRSDRETRQEPPGALEIAEPELDFFPKFENPLRMQESGMPIHDEGGNRQADEQAELDQIEPDINRETKS